MFGSVTYFTKTNVRTLKTTHAGIRIGLGHYHIVFSRFLRKDLPQIVWAQPAQSRLRKTTLQKSVLNLSTPETTHLLSPTCKGVNALSSMSRFWKAWWQRIDGSGLVGSVCPSHAGRKEGHFLTQERWGTWCQSNGISSWTELVIKGRRIDDGYALIVFLRSSALLVSSASHPFF